jgi:sulfite reductase alpha subunit-like flavoprotein
MADPAEIVVNTLREPGRLLGVVERNVDAKLIAPVLELLGWDPARQVLWGPQVQRRTDQGRQHVEADVFVADVADAQLRFVVEAKRWAARSTPGRSTKAWATSPT